MLELPANVRVSAIVNVWSKDWRFLNDLSFGLLFELVEESRLSSVCCVGRTIDDIRAFVVRVDVCMGELQVL